MPQRTDSDALLLPPSAGHADHPLVHPADRQLLDAFRQYFAIAPANNSSNSAKDAANAPLETLHAIASSFAEIPYENLTKIIKQSEAGIGGKSRRGPLEVLTDHFRWGTGGTCFSLTATLLHLVRSLGFRAEPILADRRYGADTHCAMLVWIDAVPCLLDPGYLIVQPIPLTFRQPLRLPTAFNELELLPDPRGERIELRTWFANKSTYRLTYKTAPVDAGQFLRVWDASFDWEMMSYPVLTAVRGGFQQYLQGNRLQRRARTEVFRQELTEDELLAGIVHQFRIDAQVAQRALRILNDRRSLST
jgi:arylamine N-acetyltransferase